MIYSWLFWIFPNLESIVTSCKFAVASITTASTPPIIPCTAYPSEFSVRSCATFVVRQAHALIKKGYRGRECLPVIMLWHLRRTLCGSPSRLLSACRTSSQLYTNEPHCMLRITAAPVLLALCRRTTCAAKHTFAFRQKYIKPFL